MKLPVLILLVATHCIVGLVGFGVGIYALPILTAPPAPTAAEVKIESAQAAYTATFKKELIDSDAWHWGEGEVSVGAKVITFMGKLAPGPDYKLYLSPNYVETESDFDRLKGSMVQVGDVKTFDNFLVAVPSSIDPAKYNTVIVWCESFGEFITSAKYR